VESPQNFPVIFKGFIRLFSYEDRLKNFGLPASSGIAFDMA